MFDFRFEVLHHDIGVFRQAHEHLVPLWMLEVERQTLLVAVQILLVGPASRAGDCTTCARWIWRCFYLDDVSAPIRQQSYGRRPGSSMGEVQDSNMLKRTHNPSLANQSSGQRGGCFTVFIGDFATYDGREIAIGFLLQPSAACR